ncbi:hypothetical protein LR48_Vigan01g104700 [Vigna angularis]|uniref:Uncharacterized protein n=1 Tax=Phaseolus angularis TaxID=3914 RepID=A0A0L9TM32_PHAAN|nr:hypothetical protein LR48_Vigan01g104700 [Vigna angularis]
MTNMSQTMRKGVIDDGFLNSIGKCAWNFVTNSSYETIKTRISRRPNQEEKRYIKIFKPAAETVESLDDEEIDLMAERFSKFLFCKRETNLNLVGNKEHSQNQDEDVASSSTVCERDEDQSTNGDDFSKAKEGEQEETNF